MTEDKAQALESSLREKLGASLLDVKFDRGELTITVEPAAILKVCTTLRDDPKLSFRQLSDLSGIDYLNYGKADWQTHDATSSGFSRAVSKFAEIADAFEGGRFGVAYQLMSIVHNVRLRVKALLGEDPPRIASVTEIWPVADWYEREAFDLYGILFEGHPDLRRILTDYGFIGHPFRKDFPLEGYVEVRYDPEKKRVVYQPVSIENRILVPRVIRDDGRLPPKPAASDKTNA
jgi:NADH-quinone oxidoreductase subunit C